MSIANRAPKGIIPPVVTPFREDGEVDTASLERLLNHLIDGGVHGVFLLGSSSEIAAMTPDQRDQILEVGMTTVAGRVPVYAGIIDMGTRAVLRHAERAAGFGVDGLVATPPFYTHPSDDEIVAHFRAIAEAVPLPVIAYNIPTNMNTKLEPKVVGRLAKDGLVVGVKDSGRSDANFRRMVMATSDVEGFACLTGSEVTVDFSMLAGGQGGVPGLGNVDPAGYVGLYDALVAEDYAAAREKQERLVRLGAIRTQGTRPGMGATALSIGGYKTALKLLGVIETNAMAAPTTPLNEDEAAGIRAVLEREGLL
jgi:4-hydroxy-tetrahydrodipicolinate synthase